MSTTTFRKSSLFRYISFTVLAAFTGMLPVQPSYAQVTVIMPPPGQMIHITNHFEPPQMVGLKINLKDPFSFGFIMDQGQSPMSDSAKKEEFNKIIKYFLVSLAMPNKDMWVNLSPFESKRIIPEVFGQTEMGRDLLAQDYILKQFTGSLMYPEDGLGKKFWNEIYSQAQARFGTTDIDVNTFNKVWIVADHADVYQKGDTAFLVGSHLKVMLEQDFKAIESNKEQFGDVNAPDEAQDAKTQMASQIVREIIIPAIEKEVNEGQSFAAVRQIYNAEIMATWFKKTLRASLLGEVFANKSKIAGEQVSDPQAKEKIFQQYLMAYKQGVFNYIKQDPTPDGQTITRRYLSGGMQQVTRVNGATDQDVAGLRAEEEQLRQNLAGQLGQAQGPAAVQNLAMDHFATSSSINNSTPADMFRGIAIAPVAPDIKVNLMTQLVKSLSPQQNATNEQVQELTQQLTSALSNEHATTQDVMNVLAANQLAAQSLNSSEPMAPALAQAIAATPQLTDKSSSQTTADLMSHLLNNRIEAVASEAQQFGTDEAQIAPTRLELAEADFLPATEVPQEQQISSTVVQDQLNNAVPQVESLDITAGAGTNLTPQDVSDFQDVLTALKEQQRDLAQLSSASATVAPAVVVSQIDRAMPQARALQESLTSLGDKVTDTKLLAAIRSASSNLEGAMAGLVQQRERLAPQANNGTATAPVAAVQEHLNSIIPQVEGLNITAGAGTNLTPQDVSDFQDVLTALKEQQRDLAQLSSASPTVAPAVVVSQIDRAMPQVRALEVGLASIGDKVTDTKLLAAIRSASSNLEGAMAGLQQQRERLAPQANNGTATAPVAAVQEHLNSIIPQVEGLNITAGAGTNLTPQDVSDFQDVLTALKEQQRDLAQLSSASPTVAPAVVVSQIDRAMPQVRALEVGLASIGDKVTDTKLLAAIRSASSNLEGAMAGLQQQRERLAPQANETTANGLKENPGGINLSDEHLTMNIKVDGAGMPLPPQYQDKAMMNLNGLVSIIRSITPLTQQNVPALYELTK